MKFSPIYTMFPVLYKLNKDMNKLYPIEIYDNLYSSWEDWEHILKRNKDTSKKHKFTVISYCPQDMIGKCYSMLDIEQDMDFWVWFLS